MAFDGFALFALCAQIRRGCVGGRVDKIHQPEKDEIVLAIRSFGTVHKILMSTSPTCPRVHLTRSKRENPMQAPQFSMTLRKHLSGAKLSQIIQPDFERVVQFHFETTDELGDPCVKILICEIMGKHSNIILTDQNMMIIDSIKRVSHEKSRLREVLPARPYVNPPLVRQNPLEVTKQGFFAVMNGSGRPDKMLGQGFNGISPVMAAEIISRAGVEVVSTELTDIQKGLIFDELRFFADKAEGGDFSHFIYFDGDKPVDFSVFEMKTFAGYQVRTFEDPSELVEVFYEDRDQSARQSQKTQDLRRFLAKLLERCVRKLELQRNTLEEVADRDRFRVYGELITAHMYMIEKGMDKVRVNNFYDEGREMDIPLDPRKTPIENAQQYFKRYNKEKRTYDSMLSQLAQSQEELDYLDGLLVSINAVTSEQDIEDIRTELMEQGYLRFKKSQNKKAKRSRPLEFKTADGFVILVGKNNRQNDEITKEAATSDMWLHTKDIPGSHVILKAGSEPFSDAVIESAARLAAYYSKGQQDALVAVDYCLKKFVKKPVGAKPGFVIYTNNKTAYVAPKKDVTD